MLSLLSPGWSRVDWATRWRQSGCQWPGARTTSLSSSTARTSFLTRYRWIHSAWVRITFQDKSKLTPINILFLKFGNLIMRLMMQCAGWVGRGCQRPRGEKEVCREERHHRGPPDLPLVRGGPGDIGCSFKSATRPHTASCPALVETLRDKMCRNYKITRESYPVCKFLTEKFADWTFELSCIGWWKFR